MDADRVVDQEHEKYKAQLAQEQADQERKLQVLKNMRVAAEKPINVNPPPPDDERIALPKKEKPSGVKG